VERVLVMFYELIMEQTVTENGKLFAEDERCLRVLDYKLNASPGPAKPSKQRAQRKWMPALRADEKWGGGTDIHF